MEKSCECGIVQDLLPLYKEGMTRPDTRAFVEEHLQACADCRSRLAELQAAPELPAAAAERAPLAALRRRMLRMRLQAALLAALLAAAVLCSAFGYLSAPQYLTPEQAQLSVEETGQKEYELRTEIERLKQQIEALRNGRGAPDGSTAPSELPETSELFIRCAGAHHAALESQPAEGGATVYLLTAWNTLLDVWRPAGECSALSVPWQAGDSLYYAPNDGSENVLLYGPGLPETDGFITLPRLTLGYYLLAAAALAAVLGAAWALLRKRPSAPVLGALFWAPVCYLAAHLLIKGTKTVSYNLGRDLSLILLTALLLWCAVLLAAALWRSRRQR